MIRKERKKVVAELSLREEIEELETFQSLWLPNIIFVNRSKVLALLDGYVAVEKEKLRMEAYAKRKYLRDFKISSQEPTYSRLWGQIEYICKLLGEEEKEVFEKVEKELLLNGV